MAAASVLAWLKDVYMYKPDLMFPPAHVPAWDDLHAANNSGADYSQGAGVDNLAANGSIPLILGAAQNMTSAANVGLATGVLLAVLLNSHYDTFKREWRSEYQLWTEALIIRVVFSIVCLLLALAAAPVALLIFLWFACYRNVVHLLLKFLHGSKFAGLMDGVDTVWALEEDTTKSVVNVLGMLEVDDASDNDVVFSNLRQAIVSRFLTPAIHCQKLMYLRRRSALGYFYWERQTGLHIDKHIRWMPEGSSLEDDGGISEEILGEVVSKLANAKLPTDHASSWEILLSPRPMTKISGDPFQSMEEGFPVISGQYRKYPVLFRVHHAVGDGVALLHLMKKALQDDTSSYRCTNLSQQDGNLPDICITANDSSIIEENSAIRPNFKNMANTGNIEKLEETIQKVIKNKTSTSKLQDDIGGERMFADQLSKKSYDISNSASSEKTTSGKSNRKNKSCVIQPFEFQSDKIYSTSNIHIPCYAIDKNTPVETAASKSLSIRKANTNMVVYFQKSLPAKDSNITDLEINGNVQSYNKKTIEHSVKTLENSRKDNNDVGIDMLEMDLDKHSKTNIAVNLGKESNDKFNSHLSKFSDISENFDGFLDGIYTPPNSSHHFARNTTNKPRAPRCKSPILGNDFTSVNILRRQHSPDCPTTGKYVNSSDNYCSVDYISYSSDVESRPSSPISRPVSPTPYSLFQESKLTVPFNTRLNTSRSASPNRTYHSCDDRSLSPTNIYLNSETRPTTSCNDFSNSTELSVTPSSRLSCLNKPTSTGNSSICNGKTSLETESISSYNENSASLKNEHISPFRRSVSPNKLKGISISKSKQNNTKKMQFGDKQCRSSPQKSQHPAPKSICCNTLNKNQFTIVPLDSTDKCYSSCGKDYIQANGSHKVVNILKNFFNSRKRQKMFIERKGSSKLNCYVKLLSTINGRENNRFQTLFNIWDILCALIYAPASLIHQVLMKASDKNSLHGLALSGRKVTAWYSDSSTPSICKEYRLLNTIKRIKSRIACEARFTDIFLTAVSSSLEMYFQYKGTEVPSSVNVVLPLRMEPMPEELPQKKEDSAAMAMQLPFMSTIKGDLAQTNTKNLKNLTDKVMNSESMLIDLPKEMKTLQPSNQFSVALMTLPITPQNSEEPLKPYTLAERVQEVCMQSELLRNSLDYRVNYWLMRVVATLLPVSLLRPILNSTQSTLVVSNVKGPSEDIYLGGYKLGDLVFWVPNRGTTGVGLSLMGYAGRLQLGLIADTAAVPTRCDAQVILNNIVSQLRHMDAALST